MSARYTAHGVRKRPFNAGEISEDRPEEAQGLDATAPKPRSDWSLQIMDDIQLPQLLPSSARTPP